MNFINYDYIIPQLDYFVFRTCSADWVMNQNVIDFVDLTYVVEGKAIYYVNQNPYVVEKGDLLCIPKDAARRAVIDPETPMSCYAANLLIFDMKGTEKSLPFPIHSKIGIREDLISLYQNLNIMWTQRPAGAALKIRADMLNLLYRYFHILYYKNTFEDLDPRLKKVIQYIYDHYSEVIDVDALAGIAGLNTSYFGLLFKKNTGMSVREFINMVRINYAENMLASGQFSVGQTAHRCGFTDAFYFSKVFKKLKGYSPSKVALCNFR